MREMADLIGISYSTVRFFLDRAKEALGAVSLPQATALAKELELI
jgi:LuxR family transcriptional activator of conjugal transfer of Ti plasmids